MSDESGGIFVPVNADDTTRNSFSTDGRVYFIYCPRGQARVVVCELERVRHWEGESLVRAVAVRCPVCGSCGRVTSEKPFRVEDKRTPFETENGVVYLSPLLTVDSEYICGAEVQIVEQDGDKPSSAKCTFAAIIRNGIAYDLNVVPQILTDAMKAAHAWYSRSYNAYMGSKGRIDANTRTEIEKLLNTAFTAVQDRCPVVQGGQYERGGPHSVVGCWDGLDFVCAAGQRIVQLLGGR